MLYSSNITNLAQYRLVIVLIPSDMIDESVSAMYIKLSKYAKRYNYILSGERKQGKLRALKFKYADSNHLEQLNSYLNKIKELK